MLAIQPSSSSKPSKSTPNLLPARIHHDGPLPNVHKYWTPSKDESGTSHTYFRGRRLHGTTLPLPEHYTGAVLQVTEETMPRKRGHLEEEEDEEEEVDVKIAKQVGSFDEVVVWGHGGVVEKDDAYVRGIEEWIRFSEAMHAEEDDESEVVEGKERGKEEAKEK
ncbi:hypothetical protein M011DRAFT_465226 [Sporormia fimetaria CBS 119925]|uniref:Uncharacterized protein n=1 Tax=Sporormia fimetaria CBS 119925 TaxID=1340428 RepID=A0A6A6VMV4_9PLEO|nr:hypothetical protein M011DRAFT_465226 [Sporormia fimetaria CBS 119925]